MELNDFGDEEFSHPYEFELENFNVDPKFLAVSKQIHPFKSIEDTPLVMVETEASLKRLVEDLSQETQIAVDLEVLF